MKQFILGYYVLSNAAYRTVSEYGGTKAYTSLYRAQWINPEPFELFGYYAE